MTLMPNEPKKSKKSLAVVAVLLLGQGWLTLRLS
jgi:hypothetical protein